MTEFIATTCKGREIHLLWQPSADEIPKRMEEGFIPVEMAEGALSYVDRRMLDHHNNLSHLPSACVTALQYYDTLDHRTPAKFMVNHTDADCVLTGLTLMGFLPREILEKFNSEVGILDTDPLITDYSLLQYGQHIHCWKTAMTSVKQSGWSWVYGLQLFLDIFANFDYYADRVAQLEEMERRRRKKAIEAYDTAVFSLSGRIVLVSPSRVKGSDVQFIRQSDAPMDSPKGWRHWCVIGHVVRAGSVNLSCPNKSVAEAVFGPGGLLNVYPRLPLIDGKEWGGREAVGGSPRGVVFPEELLPEVLTIVDDSLIAGEGKCMNDRT